MWHKGDYRVIFRHRFLRDWFEQQDARDLMQKMVNIGSMVGVSTNDNVQVITAAVLQKKITQDGLSAWSTLGVGYSFCTYDDQFSKKKGRKFAFGRAMRQVSSPHYEMFDTMWHENTKEKDNEVPV